MPRKGANVALSSYDDIFKTTESRDADVGNADGGEKVWQIDISELHPFEGHPFRVLDDESMRQTVESISQVGVMVPLLARPDPDGGYEIIAGHRRCHAAELAGLDKLPVIVRDLDDDEAIIAMVDSNLQREDILPSERAWAYKMKLDAVKHQGQRIGRTSAQVGQKLDNVTSVSVIAEEAGTSKTQVQRYIRLTELDPKLLDMVDEKKMGLNPAVELSYLSKQEQKELLEAMGYAQSVPSLSQAQRMKKMSLEGGCTLDSMQEIMSEVKKGEPDRVVFQADNLRKYFPRSYTSRQMEDTIIRLLEQWQKKRTREQSR